MYIIKKIISKYRILFLILIIICTLHYINIRIQKKLEIQSEKIEKLNKYIEENEEKTNNYIELDNQLKEQTDIILTLDDEIKSYE